MKKKRLLVRQDDLYGLLEELAECPSLASSEERLVAADEVDELVPVDGVVAVLVDVGQDLLQHVGRDRLRPERIVLKDLPELIQGDRTHRGAVGGALQQLSSIKNQILWELTLAHILGKTSSSPCIILLQQG